MAIFHLSTKIVSRGSGRTALGAAAYRPRLTILNGERWDFLNRKGPVRGVVHGLIWGPPDVPSWLFIEPFSRADFYRQMTRWICAEYVRK